MDDALVLRDDADGIATLTLKRPDKLNAMNPAAFVELRNVSPGTWAPHMR